MEVLDQRYTGPPPGQSPHVTYAEALVADPDVEGVDALLEGLRSDVSLYLVDTHSHPYETLARAVSLPGIERLHLLCHGEPGALRLGGQRLGADDLAKPAPKPTALRQIFLWACHAGATEDGRAFLQALADWSGATVYGTEGPVGNAEAGGSWDLRLCATPGEAVVPEGTRARTDGHIPNIQDPQYHMDVQAPTGADANGASGVRRVV